LRYVESNLICVVASTTNRIRVYFQVLGDFGWGEFAAYLKPLLAT